MLRRCVFLVWGLSILLAACQGAASSPGARGMKPGLTLAADDPRAASGEAAAPTHNPLAGAFYDDGQDGDVRARTENFFAAGKRGNAVSLDDVTNGLVDAGKPARAERMLIQRGEIRVEVARPEDVARAFVTTVVEAGGYLQSQTGTSLVVRLPAARFDELFAAVRALGRVLGESRQANDVTEEFVDLGIRLDTARKARDRLLEVLQKAEKVEDILKVEAELRRLTEEIERMEGRRKLLADQVALATLNVVFQATASAPPPPPRARQWSRFGWVNGVGAESMMGDF